MFSFLQVKDTVTLAHKHR